MNRTLKSVLCITLALVMLLCAGCAQKPKYKSFEMKLEGLVERGGVVFEGIKPGESKENVVALGITLAKEPYKTSDDGSGRSSETYPIANAVSLGNIQFKAPELQFMNGKLVDVTMNTMDEAGAKSLLEQLKKELGEPEVKNSGSVEVQRWESDQGEYLLRVSYLPKNASGKTYATLMVSYVFYEWFPDIKK